MAAVGTAAVETMAGVAGAVRELAARVEVETGVVARAGDLLFLLCSQ